MSVRLEVSVNQDPGKPVGLDQVSWSMDLIVAQMGIQARVEIDLSGLAAVRADRAGTESPDSATPHESAEEDHAVVVQVRGRPLAASHSTDRW